MLQLQLVSLSCQLMLTDTSVLTANGCVLYRCQMHVLLRLGASGVFLRRWYLALQHSLEQKMLGISWIVSGR